MTPDLERMVRDMHGALLGNEFGQVGLIKTVAEIKGKVDSHDPVIKKVVEKEENRNKLRIAIVSGVVLFVAGITTQIILIVSHLK